MEIWPCQTEVWLVLRRAWPGHSDLGPTLGVRVQLHHDWVGFNSVCKNPTRLLLGSTLRWLPEWVLNEVLPWATSPPTLWVRSPGPPWILWVSMCTLFHNPGSSICALLFICKGHICSMHSSMNFPMLTLMCSIGDIGWERQANVEIHSQTIHCVFYGEFCLEWVMCYKM